MAAYHQQALELARDGKWKESHSLIQQFDDNFASLIHGYLHKVEGDLPNAAYWYKRAGEQDPKLSLDEELEHLLKRANNL